MHHRAEFLLLILLRLLRLDDERLILANIGSILVEFDIGSCSRTLVQRI